MRRTLFFLTALLVLAPLPVRAEEAVPAAAAAPPVLVVETTQGSFELTLRPDVAPKAVENMLRLAYAGYYDGILFHRIIKGFMIQGGDPEGTGAGGESVWGEPFPDEVHQDVVFDGEGILAMANSGPNTNGSQFFITLGPTPHLNGRHTIFGKVTQGIEVVRALGDTPTDGSDRPQTDQKIVRMSLKK